MLTRPVGAQNQQPFPLLGSNSWSFPPPKRTYPGTTASQTNQRPPEARSLYRIAPRNPQEKCTRQRPHTYAACAQAVIQVGALTQSHSAKQLKKTDGVVNSVLSICRMRRNSISSVKLMNLQAAPEAPKIILGISPKHCQSARVWPSPASRLCNVDHTESSHISCFLRFHFLHFEHALIPLGTLAHGLHQRP